MKRTRLMVPVILAVLAALLVGGSAAAQKGPPQPPVHVLLRDTPIHGANGLGFDSQNRLYVASVFGSEIVVMDPDSGRILQRLGAARGVDTPDDLTFGPDGSLYWTAIVTGEVGKMAPDGTKSTVAMLPPGVNPITFSDTGRLFVALDFLGDALYEVYPDGSKLPRLIAQNLGFLNGMDWGPDGFLYGPLMTKGQVVKIDVDTAEITTMAGGFGVPVAVKFGPDGALYVLAQWTGEVWRLDLQAGTREVIGRLLPGIDNLAFDSRGRLFVSHAEDGSIARILPSKKGAPVSPAGLIAPGGVALLPGPGGRETLFVADLWTLRWFDAQTGTPRPLGHYTRNVAPLTVAPFGDKLVTTSFLDNSVRIWNPATEMVDQSYTDFAVPVNAIQFQGGLVVAEAGTSSVVRLTSSGQHEVLTKLAVPAGLAARGDDLWVADRVLGQVFQIVAGGSVLQPPKLVAGGLAGPEGLAAAPDGSLVVVEAAKGRLSRIDLDSGKVQTIATGLATGLDLPNSPPTVVFTGVAVSPSGAIYVTGDKGSVVYRLNAHPGVGR